MNAIPDLLTFRGNPPQRVGCFLPDVLVGVAEGFYQLGHRRRCTLVKTAKSLHGGKPDGSIRELNVGAKRGDDGLGFGAHEAQHAQQLCRSYGDLCVLVPQMLEKSGTVRDAFVLSSYHAAVRIIGAMFLCAGRLVKMSRKAGIESSPIPLSADIARSLTSSLVLFNR